MAVEVQCPECGEVFDADGVMKIEEATMAQKQFAMVGNKIEFNGQHFATIHEARMTPSDFARANKFLMAALGFSS